jgi:hypothetical protein
MRKIFVGLLALALIAGVANADYLVQQPNGQWGIIKAFVDASGIQQPSILLEGQKATYRAAGGQSSFDAAPTDALVISGSATKTVRVTKYSVCGVATAATNVIINLQKRSTADTGGTSAGMTLVPNDSASAAATATILLYSANPTLGNSLGQIFSKRINLGVTGTGTAGCIDIQFGDVNDQTMVLRGIAQQLVLNLGAFLAPGTALQHTVELTEE